MFQMLLLEFYAKEDGQTLNIDDIKTFIFKRTAGIEFSEGEIEAAILIMHDDTEGRRKAHLNLLTDD